MNRLILVGNGFDLAHDLKTSYKNFIDDFWKFTFSEITKMSILGKVNYENNILKVNNENFIQLNTLINKPNIKNYSDFKQVLSYYYFSHEITNNFFDIINKLNNDYNWVDIENEYYKQLLNAKSKNSLPLPKNNSEIDKIVKLNINFQNIKNILEEYLVRIEKSINLKMLIMKHINSIFQLKDIESKYQSEVIKIIIKNLKNQNTQDYDNYPDSLKSLIRSITLVNNLEIESYVKEQVEAIGIDILKIINLYPTHTLILNFNYTSTTEKYIEEFNRINGYSPDYYISEIHIHGELNDKQNPIIFGFGDDVDKKYQEFEDLNDNKYLENFKSIAYLQTDNYKKLLEFINSEEYQVFIFGHSCGISDRTMLNTIFEHDNCKSIKPFYYRKKDNDGNYIVDKNGNYIDNYTEIVQNISRNFNDKKKYRDRVVNKTYCEPLT